MKDNTSIVLRIPIIWKQPGWDDLTPIERNVLWSLASYYGINGEQWGTPISQTAIAKRAGLSRWSVCKALRRLTASEWIIRIQEDGKIRPVYALAYLLPDRNINVAESQHKQPVIDRNNEPADSPDNPNVAETAQPMLPKSQHNVAETAHIQDTLQDPFQEKKEREEEERTPEDPYIDWHERVYNLWAKSKSKKLPGWHDPTPDYHRRKATLLWEMAVELVGNDPMACYDVLTPVIYVAWTGRHKLPIEFTLDDIIDNFDDLRKAGHDERHRNIQ